MKRVAIQGYSGCFHEQAARLFWCGDGARTGAVPLEEDIQTVECDTFDGLYAALDTGNLREQGSSSLPGSFSGRTGGTA